MRIRSTVQKIIEPICRNKPKTRKALSRIDNAVEFAQHAVVTRFPGLAYPDPRRIYVTLTAQCNLRCKGCLYGVNEFMPGEQLPWPIVRDLLSDAALLGIRNIRLYGGEPMMHKDLPRIVRHATDLGLHTWMTTNGVLLKKKFDALYDAGLREFSFGFYGIGDEYDQYVRQNRSYQRVADGLAYVRDRYGSDVKIKMDWLLMRPTCNLDTLRATWDFARRFNTPMYVNLIHYSLPYFTKRNQRELQFDAGDRPAIDAVVNELLRLQEEHPEMFLNSRLGLKSIPDWLLRGAEMRVPCTETTLIWVGADGTVQMCYVTFKLGNLHEKRLSQMLYTPAHKQAARNCVTLNCPNCHCSYDKRTSQHLPSRRLYAT
ncbi:MAG: radical SAM/SPASM domain-containing protein [Woeseiaceae bacterium]